MKAFVTEFRLDGECGREYAYGGEPRRFTEPTYTVTLRMICDAEAADAFQDWIREQYGYKSRDATREPTMLLEDGRELLLTDRKKR